MLPSAAVNGPKLMLNATLGGIYGALLVVLVVSVVNPDGKGGWGAIPALLPVALLYAAAAGIVWPLLYGSIRFFASHALRLPWVSLRYVMAFHVVNTAAIVASCWATLSEYRRFLGPEVAGRLATICAAVTFAWLYAAILSLTPRLGHTPWLQASAAGLALAGLLAPPWGRPPPAAGAILAGVQPPARRLLLLNFDGADLEDILTLEAQGALPTFARLREEGVYGRLRSVRPCEGPVTRTTLVTGKLPFRHGVRAGEARRVLRRGPELDIVPPGIGFDLLMGPILETRRLSVLDRRSLALWDIAAMMGGAGAADGWDTDMDQDPDPRQDAPSPGWARAVVADVLDVDAVDAADPAASSRFVELARAIQADGRVAASLNRFLEDGRPGVAALSFPGLDAVAHRYLRYARPAEFGNVRGREIELYGGVLEWYYRHIDAIVARVLEAIGPDTTLLVTSSHGIEPVPLRRRLLAMTFGREGRSGTHHDAPGGFLFARGPQVRAGEVLERGTITDVVPTALYAIGLPVAIDLDGTIQAGVFTPRYTREHPAAVIESYGPPPWLTGAGRSDILPGGA